MHAQHSANITESEYSPHGFKSFLATFCFVVDKEIYSKACCISAGYAKTALIYISNWYLLAYKCSVSCK